jgi:hypothetical protein
MYNDKKLHLLYEKGLSAMNESKVEKIIPPEQREVAHFLRQKVFSQIPKNHFFLVGGTAVALKYGHRQSIDFDFFSFPQQFVDNNGGIQCNDDQKIMGQLDFILRREGIYQRKDVPIEYGQLQYKLGEVGLTFFAFQNMAAMVETDIYNIPQFPSEVEINPLGFETLSIKDIAGLKAFARTKRSKMKDIVDIAEILHHDLSLSEIMNIAENQFGYDISKKEILLDLSNIKDILENPNDEKIEYIGNRTTEYYVDFIKKECLKFYNGNS